MCCVYRGMRSGTLPAPLVVGLGAAAELSAREMEVGVVTVSHDNHVTSCSMIMTTCVVCLRDY